ncbi:MAG: hypothetical protein RSB77_05445, partial [Bacilli bacterium]
PLSSSSRTNTPTGNTGANAPLSSSSRTNTPTGNIGANAPLSSSSRTNVFRTKPKDIYKPNKIRLPKNIDIKTIEKEPTTSNTIVDIAVSKYAEMAQQVYNSPTLKSARNTYHVSKNSASALKKENNNEKRD